MLKVGVDTIMIEKASLKNFGFQAPDVPSEVRFHRNTKGGIIGYRETSLSMNDLAEENARLRDALSYIMKEAVLSVNDTKKLGTIVHGTTTAWELVCELQSSFERIRDNAQIELNR
jgi:hypothetical protein